MTCAEFVSLLDGAVEAPAALAHMRDCESCMNIAAEHDPMNLFRAMGGEEIEPPGGVDAFVAEVMDQVRIQDRRAAISAQPPVKSYSWRWTAAAAAVIVGVLSFATLQRPGAAPGITNHAPAIVEQFAPVSLPVVENYDSGNAMIVEVPQQHSEIQLVMIFDESLPADL